MTIREYIDRLQALHDKHGNWEVVDKEGGFLGEPEFSPSDSYGNAEDVYVLCSKA